MAAALKAPVSSPGQWVPRKSFTGRKSFGAFECDLCKKVWVSAHAFKEYKQGCQQCEAESLPLFMWHNFEHNDRHDDEGRTDDKPHDSDRCEACRAGVCREGLGAGWY
jgi:hypothetical protein